MKTALLQHGLHEVEFRLGIIHDQNFFRHGRPPQKYPQIEVQLQDHVQSVFRVLRLESNGFLIQLVTHFGVIWRGQLGKSAVRCLSQLEILSHRLAFRRLPMRNAA
jgi:hypothetical protein